MTASLIAFGANMGDRSDCLDRTVQRLSAHSQVDVTARSRGYQTRAIGGPGGQGDFLNAAMLIETSLSPQALMNFLHEVETEFGRQRVVRWNERTIDLDLLLYDTLTINAKDLQVPHPHMAFRRFVLEPAVEIAPDLIHPCNGWSLQQLLDHLDSAPEYLALIGAPGSGKTRLAQQVAQRMQGTVLLSPNPDMHLPGDTERSLIQERAKLLETVRGLPPTTFAVSDFWIQQSLAYVDSHESGHSESHDASVLQQLMQSVPQPKLRVLLQPENTPIEPCLETLAHRPHQGPLLHLTSSEESVLLQELDAAVQSMR